MLIPIGHEDMRGRRWPYVTVGIIALNFLIFLLSQGPIQRGQQQYAQRLGEALKYYVQHAYLKPAPPLDTTLTQLSAADTNRLERIVAASQAAREGDDNATEEARAGEQAQLDGLCRQAIETQKQSFLQRYAYVPAGNNTQGLVTSQFLHGGWLHLIFNMLFLWLTGCNMEDRWGRALFPAFYVAAGVVAALAHKASAPHSLAPLIGASGAIAGCMGAFLVCFARTKIRFMWFLFLRPRFFSAPAYLMLPLWLLSQVFWGSMASSVGVQAGVAFWAHVGGFIFGTAFAVALGLSGFDEKISQAIEGQVSLQQAPEVIQAQEMVEQGRAAEAIPLLEQFAARQPANIDAQLELLRASQAAQDRTREARAYNRLIGLYLMQNVPDTAVALYQETVLHDLDMQVPAPLRLKVARQMERLGELDAAAEEYRNIHGHGNADATSFQALLAHANLALKQGNKAEAIQLFTIAQHSPVPHLEWETNIAHGLNQANALPGTPGASAAG